MSTKFNAGTEDELGIARKRLREKGTESEKGRREERAKEGEIAENSLKFRGERICSAGEQLVGEKRAREKRDRKKV